MNRVRTSIVSLVLFAAACGEVLPPSTDEGAVNLHLQVGDAVTLGSVAYDVSGNGFRKNGTLDVSNSATISGRLSGIPAGTGFVLTLSASASNDATITCQGSATFNVTGGGTTTVMVNLRCKLPSRTGSVWVGGSVNLCPRIDAVDVLPAEAVVGSSIAVSAAATDVDARPAVLSYAWTSGAGPVTGAATPNATVKCAVPGPATVTLTVSDGDCSDSVVVSVTCTPGSSGGTDAGAAAIVVNEVESNGGTPGDWAELFNAGGQAANVSGWVFKDNDDTHVYTIPAGTLIAPGSYLVLEEAAFGFGLGGADSARLYDATGNLVDSDAWTAHAAVTYGRCPNGTGGFVANATSTKGAANACAAPPQSDAGAVDSAPALSAWPGPDDVTTADVLNQFGDNLSGLTYQPAANGAPAVLWGALNGPGSLYRMIWNGTTFAFDTNDGWGAGKPLRYPSGTGNPDTEGVTKAEWDQPFIYVSTERNNDASSVSRLAILRLDSSAPGTELVATHEWNITADLPAVGPNLGLEALTWIPDTFLVAGGFIDDSKSAPYNPALYPNHGAGLFFVGVEANGAVYAYALDHLTGAFARVTTLASGHPAVMDLAFDRDTGALWALCDNTCANTSNVLALVGGKFQVRKKFARPSTLPDSNNEGFTLAPEAECLGGLKSVFWADDSHFGGHALRRGRVTCGSPF